ncbi:MAG: ABC transporter permease [Mesorhizobium sp.]|nr:MAG: ABC transporter permease [Mesorhizobium sp.]
MAIYILRRLVSTVAVMAMVGIFVFLLLRLAPGDPAAMIAGKSATAEMIAGIREQLGLNDPLPVQFVHWAFGILRGDLGISIFSGRPVLELISQRLEPTLSLSILTMILSATVGGYVPIDGGLGPWLVHLILPTVALSLGFIAFIARVTRASMLEVLSEDYMRTAAAKGASSYAMLFHHALKNAGVPILTVIGISFAYMIGGVVLTETVFNIPGIGRLVVDAINYRDYPIIQSVLILTSGLYVLINLTVDLAYTMIDPRIRY